MSPEASSRVDTLRGVSETLLIPLACRARASRDKRFRNFSDKKAEEICARFDIDIERYAADRPTLRGAIARSQWYDDHVAAFLDNNDGAVVLSVGSGLNTMYERVSARLESKNWRWIDTDLSDVVALRREVFDEAGNREMHVFDASKPNWTSCDWLDGGGPLLVISEAVLIYLPESDVKAFFASLAEFGARRDTCAVLFDYCSPLMMKRSAQHPALKKLKSEAVVFRSSMRRGADIQHYDPRWRIKAETSTVMARSGIGPALVSIIFQALTFGRRIYALAEASLD